MHQTSRERSTAPADFRSHSPRFVGPNLDHNLALVEALSAVAAAKGVSVAQIAIAWVLSRGSDVVPLVGARTRERLAEALGSLDMTLSEDEQVRIEAAIPVGAAAGERYNERGMASLDSERGHAQGA